MSIKKVQMTDRKHDPTGNLSVKTLQGIIKVVHGHGLQQKNTTHGVSPLHKSAVIEREGGSLKVSEE